ncbi:unnamed protein product [Periconia digitata]|uniref:geranylgeranyl diphosphate synthase n=1 Tax=Periconia digitata TaxID=1303443 RepID=A0A9W4UPW6_9PLEO|nr:unnamed protein product [Periconia digitata]
MATSSFIRNSLPLPPEVYEGEEYFCRFTPRIHRDVRLADAGSWQCQVDFLESSSLARVNATRNKAVSSYAVGCINPVVGNFTALCACEALSDRLALTTYMVEYAYIHDDVIEYSEIQDESQLVETNQQLMKGLSLHTGASSSSKDEVKRRQLHAKMIMELMEVDKDQAAECLRLWKEMSDVFVQIRDMKFTVLDTYLKYRVVDAGCPWTMSLLCFSMDFKLNKEEEKKTAAITQAAYDAWVLVNDYFSWEKEWSNHVSNGGDGVIANAVFLFMRWYSIDAEASKVMLRKEIVAREEMYCREKEAFLASGEVTEKTSQWLELLDLVTAGNFVWSMTTARYRLGAEDVYPRLRAECSESPDTGPAGSLGCPISVSAAIMADRIDDVLKDRRYLDFTIRERRHIPDIHEGRKLESHSDSRPNKPQIESSHVTPTFSQYHYEMILQPQDYIDMMPSKGIRNSVIDGLEVWYRVPERSLGIIRDVVNLLHSCSLMLDDIEDNSPMRRGYPATHAVFGVSQTINTANYLMLKALRATDSLSARTSRIVLDKLMDGHIGQGLDLLWTYHTTVPTEEEYFLMVDGKTGSLFMLIAEMMRSEATQNKNLDAGLLMKILGRFFQARDDCQNLRCEQYTKNKGFAEDIGEGKMSLPLIHALRQSSHRHRILSVLQQRKASMSLSPELRKLVLEDIKAAGGLEYAIKKTRELQESISETLAMYEEKVGEKNWLLRLAQKRLEVDG